MKRKILAVIFSFILLIGGYFFTAVDNEEKSTDREYIVINNAQALAGAVYYDRVVTTNYGCACYGEGSKHCCSNIPRNPTREK